MENECSWYQPSCALKWLADELKAIWLWIYDGVMSGISSLLSSIPVPSFLEHLPSYTLPSGVAWASQFFELEYGLVVIVGAYVARFILRRIPLIG